MSKFVVLAHGFGKLDIVKRYVCWRIRKAFHVGTPKLVSRTWKSIKTKDKRKVLTLTSNNEQDKIISFKNKITITKNKNMRRARQMWKHIFIMLTYANINMKKTWQGFVVRLCLKLMLNKLKEGFYFYLCPFAELVQEKFPRRFLCVHKVKKLFENLFNWELTMS